jgi:hypothetical protein
MSTFVVLLEFSLGAYQLRLWNAWISKYENLGMFFFRILLYIGWIMDDNIMNVRPK